MKKNKDIFEKHIITDFKQSTPSVDFTNSVMQKIENPLSNSIVVAPLLSDSIWKIIVIITLIIISTSYVIEITNYDFNAIQNLNKNWFLNYTDSAISIFKVIFITGILVLIDIVYLRYNNYYR